MKNIIIALLLLSTTVLFGQTSSTINPLANATTDPFGTTLTDSFTLSSKTDYSLNKTISVTANTQWLIGCIHNSTVKSSDCNPDKLGLGWELFIEGNGSYSDVWKGLSNTATRSLQYGIETSALHTDSQLDGKMISGWVDSLSDAHDTTQAIKANTRVATGRFLQWGSIEDTTKTYGLYYAQISQSYFDVYQPAHNYNSTGLTLSTKDRWEWNKTELDMETSTTFPFAQFTNYFQSAVDGKLSYWVSKSVSVTFQADYNYYAIAPIGYDTNAVATSIGVTWKPK